MSSTREVKDAVRLAQQYNIVLYRYLINGLVDNSLAVSQLKVEFDEYTRSSMKFFDRLYQIRDSKIPFVRVREEQINVFREQVKRNDKLRQEVHKIQRGLWTRREMGQQIPMANKHMISQGFPELCVSTSPDKVPLTVLCDQILRKYNLRNERPIITMLKWAEEEYISRKMANTVPMRPSQNQPQLLSVRPEKPNIQPAVPVPESHDVTPVMSWEDASVQLAANMPINDVKPTNSCEGMTQELVQPTSLSLREMEKHSNESARVDDESSELCQSINLTADVRKDVDAMVNEFLSALKENPELNINYSKSVNKKLPSVVNVPVANSSKVSTTSPKLDTSLLAESLTNISTIPKKNQEHEDFKEKYIPYTPRNYPVMSWDELINKFQKVENRNVTSKEESTNVTKKPIDTNPQQNLTKPVSFTSTEQVKSPDNQETTDAVLSVLSSNQTTSVLSSNQTTNLLDHKAQGPPPTTHREKFENIYNLPSVNMVVQTPALQSEIKKTKIEFKKPQPLVGSDRPHVYENKIKRTPHIPKKPADNLTAAESLQYKRKREEQFAALELKKQRTKNLLKEQYNKSWDGKASIHYYKVQNTPKVEKAIKTTPSTVPPKYQPAAKVVNQPATRVVTQPAARPVSKVSNVGQTSRKRPASSSVDTPSSAKRRARYQHRIILRIFREGSDWNVEQIVDRY